MIVGVNVEVSADIDRARKVFLYFFNAGFKKAQGRDKFSLSTAGWEVNSYVGSRAKSREGEEEREHSRRGGREDLDEGVKFRPP